MLPRPPRRGRVRRALLAGTFAVATALIAAGITVAAQPDPGVGVPPQANVDTVTVCHVPPGSDVPSSILTIPEAALGGHLGHGDFVIDEGQACPATPPPPPPPTDVCPNLEGNQATVPEGLELIDGQCVAPPPPTDVCPNLEGDQATVPTGLELIDGQCVAPPPPPETPDVTPETPTVTPPEPDTGPEPGATDPPATLGEEDIPVDTPTATAGATDAPAADPTTAASGELPFTGLDQNAVALLGGGLLLLGLALHAAAPRRPRRAVNDA